MDSIRTSVRCHIDRYTAPIMRAASSSYRDCAYLDYAGMGVGGDSRKCWRVGTYFCRVPGCQHGAIVFDNQGDTRRLALLPLHVPRIRPGMPTRLFPERV